MSITQSKVVHREESHFFFQNESYLNKMWLIVPRAKFDKLRIVCTMRYMKETECFLLKNISRYD